VALLLLPTYLVERQKERDRESLHTPWEMTSSGRVILSEIGGCVLPLLSLNDIAKHENEEKKRD